MSEPSPDASRLLSLLAEAATEANRLGPEAGPVAAALEEARRHGQLLGGAASSAAEGVRVEDLTTGNDK